MIYLYVINTWYFRNQPKRKRLG